MMSLKEQHVWEQTGGTAPRSLNPGIRWRWVANFNAPTVFNPRTDPGNILGKYGGKLWIGFIWRWALVTKVMNFRVP